MLSKILQTGALIIAAPFLFIFGLATFILVSAGHTFTAIGKVWR